ncbi:GNAT family N-acetyltransferase [Phenylobacterium sp.]|jgi:GNAT superfamily N-acetyltransferase|uniref:GNAT family N-acetyltransferase n=1 Tax=Phenylobacterium sp. TaxID=1871053 RepID=UPI002F934437
MVQLVRVAGELPEGFAALRAAANAERFNALRRLEAEWAATPEMFVCLLAASSPEGLSAIGGLTHEPEPGPERAMRVRRLYVHPDARRCGVGRTLVNALVQEALDSVTLVTVNARDTLAPSFWTQLGFRAVAGRPWTHEFRADYSAAQTSGWWCAHRWAR